MSLKKKIIASFACLALCASFVPVLAIADQADGEALDVENDIELTTAAEEGAGQTDPTAEAGEDAGEVEMAAQADNGVLVFKDATVSQDTLSYEGGYQVKAEYETGTWNGSELSLANGVPVTFTFTPPAGYSGNASMVVNGEKIPFNGGMCAYRTDFSTQNAITVEFDPGIGPQKTREVKLTIDDASLPMLASKCTLKVGYDADDAVVFGVEDNGKVIEVSEDTLKRTLLSFTIDNKYFIPTAIVNGKTFATFDEGTTPDDPSRVNIVVELTGDDAAADEFNVNLSIGAQANVNLQSQSVSRASASYMLVESGEALVKDVAGTEIDLAINDTATDTSVAGAVASFDLGAQVNGAAAAEIETPLDINMTIDTSVYTGSNYVVDREHNGVHTVLPTTYDPATGELGFSSDLYSKYTLVDKDAATKASSASTKSALAKTGDPLALSGLAVAGFAALGAIAFASRKLREQR